MDTSSLWSASRIRKQPLRAGLKIHERFNLSKRIRFADLFTIFEFWSDLVDLKVAKWSMSHVESSIHGQAVIFTRVIFYSRSVTPRCPQPWSHPSLMFGPPSVPNGQGAKNPPFVALPRCPYCGVDVPSLVFLYEYHMPTHLNVHPCLYCQELVVDVATHHTVCKPRWWQQDTGLSCANSSAFWKGVMYV